MRKLAPCSRAKVVDFGTTLGEDNASTVMSETKATVYDKKVASFVLTSCLVTLFGDLF